MSTKPSKKLDTFPNPRASKSSDSSFSYEINFTCPEFTCLCPMTGQPDFATIHINYIPDQLCVELKSLKLFLWSFRDEGAFHEKVTNEILENLVEALSPIEMTVSGDFYVRGGISTEVVAKYVKDKV